MSKNLYANEIATAYRFLMENEDDIVLKSFIQDIKTKDLIHSDRWSLCYDFLKQYYPDASGTIVTGLTYYLES